MATDPTGTVSGDPHIFTQWSANGNGLTTLKVPMPSAGFRNLSGLGTAPIRDGYAEWNLHLSGPTNQRSVAHFPTAKLPLKVTAAYELDGKRMKAKDIVGKTGELKVSYTVNNVTTKPTPVTFKNVLGTTEKTKVKAPIPVAAQLSVSIPPDFTNLKGPGASASGNGNGTSSAEWSLFLFKPLGGVKQSVTYQAHVTDAVVPSATVEAAVLPPIAVKPLPTISEPGAPAVPVVTLGARLAALQKKLQAARARLAAKASAALNSFKGVAVPQIQQVSAQAATVAANLAGGTRAGPLASQAAAVHAGLVQAEAEAADAASRMADIRNGLEGLPDAVKGTRAYQALLSRVDDAQARLTAHAAGLSQTAASAGVLGNGLPGLSTAANDLSSKAAEAANNLSNATLSPRERQSRQIPTLQIGGGAHLDQAVGQLDGAITQAADKVDKAYAYLTALEKRAADNLLPAGNALGATVQAGAFVYSIGGANDIGHQTHLSVFIGGFALAMGIGLGIALYRMRRGMPSSLKPPKTTAAGG